MKVRRVLYESMVIYYEALRSEFDEEVGGESLESD